MPFKWFPYFIYLKEINRNIIRQHNVGLVRPFIFVAHKIPQLGFQYLFLYILANNKLIPVRAYYHVRIALSVCEADGFFLPVTSKCFTTSMWVDCIATEIQFSINKFESLEFFFLIVDRSLKCVGVSLSVFINT